MKKTVEFIGLRILTYSFIFGLKIYVNMDENSLRNIAEQLREPHGDEADKVGEFMNKGNLLINQYTIEALELSKGDRVLEIGMGNGHFVKEILSADYEVKYTGCDLSESMVAAAIANNNQYVKSNSAKFDLGNVEHLPYPDMEFDKVFTVHTIYFWENSKAVLSEIYRVLKPGGKVYISLRPKTVMKEYPFVKYGFKLFTKDKVTEMLLDNSFKAISSVEKTEPDIDFQGMRLKVETLIVGAEKPLN